MSSASAGLGWDAHRLRNGVRFVAFAMHMNRCARDPERGPWAAHQALTSRAWEGPKHGLEEPIYRPRGWGSPRRDNESDGGGRERDRFGGPLLAAGPPQAPGTFDPTHDLANLIANAESEGIAVTWCKVDVTLGGFVYRPPRRTARRRDPREAPREVDARGLPCVTIGDLVVVLNPAQSWVATFEVMLHELAHALLGHLGARPSVRQARDLIAWRRRPSLDVGEFEANAAAYVAVVRRGAGVRRTPLMMLMGAQFARLERDGALASIDLLEIFRVAEILAAWCRIRPHSVGVRATRDRRPLGPPAGAIRIAEEREESWPVVRERELVPG